MQTVAAQSFVALKEIPITINRISEIATSVAAAVEQQGAMTSKIASSVQQAALIRLKSPPTSPRSIARRSKPDWHPHEFCSRRSYYRTRAPTSRKDLISSSFWCERSSSRMSGGPLGIPDRPVRSSSSGPTGRRRVIVWFFCYLASSIYLTAGRGEVGRATVGHNRALHCIRFKHY